MSAESPYTLYNYCTGVLRRQPENPLHHIAPATPVPGALFNYKHYPQGIVFREVDTSRPIGSEARLIDIVEKDEAGILEPHALRIRLYAAELKLMAGMSEEAKSQKLFAKTAALLGTWRTSYICDGIRKFREMVPSVATADWNSVDSSPLQDIADQISKFRVQTSVMPNRIVMGWDALNKLSQNADIRDRLQYSSTKTLTPELLLEMLRLDGTNVTDMKFIISNVPVGTTAPGPGVPFSGKDVIGNEMWLAFTDDQGLINGDLSGARTFSIAGEDMIDNMRTYRDDDLNADVYEAEADRLFVVTCPDCITRFGVA